MRKGWDIKKLNEVCQFKSGTTISNELERSSGEILYAKVGDMTLPGNEKEILGSSRFVNLKDINPNQLIPAGSVIFPKRGGAIATNKKRRIVKPTIVDLNTMAVTPSDFLDSDFLFHWFQQIDLASISNGTSIPQINNYSFNDISICFPKSLPEQKRIVAILDEAFAAIAKAKANTEKNLQNAKELFESYLQNVFENKGEGWEEKCIEDVAKVVNGYSFKSKDFSPKNEIKSIKITNVGVKEFVEEEGNLLPGKFKDDYKEYIVNEGNIVIALTRTIISAGLKVTIVPKSYQCSLLNQRVAALIPNKEVLTKYLYCYLCTASVSKYVLSNVNTLMQPNLSINDLKRMLAPIPSFQEQKEIVENLDALSEETKKLETIYQQKLDGLEELKKSILQKAFSGELTEKEVLV